MPSIFAQSIMEELEYEYHMRITLCNSTKDVEVRGVVVDTGFTGDIYLPYSYMNRLLSLGFRVYRLSSEDKIVDAFGREVSGSKYMCYAKLKQMQDHEFAVDMFVEVMICGEGDPAIGLESLSRWIAEFDGPNRVLSVIEP